MKRTSITSIKITFLSEENSRLSFELKIYFKCQNHKTQIQFRIKNQETQTKNTRKKSTILDADWRSRNPRFSYKLRTAKVKTEPCGMLIYIGSQDRALIFCDMRTLVLPCTQWTQIGWPIFVVFRPNSLMLNWNMNF